MPVCFGDLHGAGQKWGPKVWVLTLSSVIYSYLIWARPHTLRHLCFTNGVKESSIAHLRMLWKTSEGVWTSILGKDKLLYKCQWFSLFCCLLFWGPDGYERNLPFFKPGSPVSCANSLGAEETLICDPGDLVSATPRTGTFDPDLLWARKCTKRIPYILSLSHPQNTIR